MQTASATLRAPFFPSPLLLRESHQLEAKPFRVPEAGPLPVCPGALDRVHRVERQGTWARHTVIGHPVHRSSGRVVPSHAWAQRPTGVRQHLPSWQTPRICDPGLALPGATWGQLGGDGRARGTQAPLCFHLPEGPLNPLPYPLRGPAAGLHAEPPPRLQAKQRPSAAGGPQTPEAVSGLRTWPDSRSPSTYPLILCPLPIRMPKNEQQAAWRR